MREHTHFSMFGDPICRCTEEEARNLDVVYRYRMASVSERAPFWAPGFERLRPGFKNIGEIYGGRGLTDESIANKEIDILHLDAKGDTVWGIWRILGRHTGEFYGVPATEVDLDVIEVALWHLKDGLITAAWYFGDDLGALRQMGVTPNL